MGRQPVVNDVKPMTRRGTSRPGHLAVSCWCEKFYVSVPEADVLAGRTASCGRPNCAPG